MEFTQLCVWQGVVLGNESPGEFEKCMEEVFSAKFKFAQEVITNPDLDKEGKNIPGTGGRIDLLFYVADADVETFAEKRLPYSIRWWEDVVKYCGESYLYSKDVLSKYPVRW